MGIIYLLIAILEILVQIRVLYFVGLKIEINEGLLGQNPLDLEIKPENKTDPNDGPNRVVWFGSSFESSFSRSAEETDRQTHIAALDR